MPSEQYQSYIPTAIPGYNNDIAEPSTSTTGSIIKSAEQEAFESGRSKLPSEGSDDISFENSDDDKDQSKEASTEASHEEIEKGCLRTAVTAIYEYHYLEQEKGTTPSDTLSTCSLIEGGFFSVAQVTEALAKVYNMSELDTSDGRTLQRCCEWYLHQLDGSEEIDVKGLASTITGIRHSLSHGSAQYERRLLYDFNAQYRCHVLDPITRRDASSFILYKLKRDNETYEKVYEYTAEQFTAMCAKMREAFLRWKPTAEYLPTEAQQQAPQIRASELYTAVMCRGDRDATLSSAVEEVGSV